MNILQRLALLGVRLAFNPNLIPQSAFWSLGQPVWTQWDYDTYVKDAVQGNPYSARALAFITDAIGQVEPVVKRRISRKGTDEWEAVEEGHPLQSLLVRPTERGGWPEWSERMFGALLIKGDCYAKLVGPDNPMKPPKYMYPLRPDKVAPVPGDVSRGQPEVIRFDYRPRMKTEQIEPEKVFWFNRWKWRVRDEYFFHVGDCHIYR